MATQGKEQYLDYSIIVLLLLLQGYRVLANIVNNLLGIAKENQDIGEGDFGVGQFGPRLLFYEVKASSL